MNLSIGGSPAFILPEGFYANSADGSIIYNYFVGLGSNSGAVPLPTSILLVLLGAAGLLRHRHSG